MSLEDVGVPCQLLRVKEWTVLQRRRVPVAGGAGGMVAAPLPGTAEDLLVALRSHRLGLHSWSIIALDRPSPAG